MGPVRPRSTERLEERVAADPTDAFAWFALGEDHENVLELADALNCYEHGELFSGSLHGHLLLARVNLRLQDWEHSIAQLNRIFAVERSDSRDADFREAHYLRGAVAYLQSDWSRAKMQFKRFIELGGEENRVEDWLDEIDNQLR